MQQDAMVQLEALDLSADALPFAMTLYDSTWHQGVIGILASRIRERTHRPTVVFAQAGDGWLKGSGRSIPGIHLRDILDQVATQHPGLLSKFGGHAMAAGLSLAEEQLDDFQQALNDVVATTLNHQSPQRVQDSDGVLQAAELTLTVAEQVSDAGPWGQQFPEPIFDGAFSVKRHRIVGEKHLKLSLEIEGTELEAIAFNIDVAGWLGEPLQRIGALYRLGINDYRGERSPQLVIDSFWAL
jgi:single-stranded-DNA-specific exonuclease